MNMNRNALHDSIILISKTKCNYQNKYSSFSFSYDNNNYLNISIKKKKLCNDDDDCAISMQ